MAALHAENADLRTQVLEQNAAIKRVEDQLELVSESADRHALAQQELIEELKIVGKKVEALKAVSRTVSAFGWAILTLLAFSIAFNIVLFLHMQRVLP
jgi:cell division protein FtsX